MTGVASNTNAGSIEQNVWTAFGSLQSNIIETRPHQRGGRVSNLDILEVERHAAVVIAAVWQERRPCRIIQNQATIGREAIRSRRHHALTDRDDIIAADRQTQLCLSQI